MVQQIKSPRIQAVAFHTLRVGLILSLLTAGLFTVLYWVYYLVLVYGQTMGVQSLTANEYYGKNIQGLAEVIPQVAGDLGWLVVKALIVAVVFVVLLLLLPRVRKYHKSLIVTVTTIIVFCLVAILACDMVVTRYLRNLQYDHNLYTSKQLGEE